MGGIAVVEGDVALGRNERPGIVVIPAEVAQAAGLPGIRAVGEWGAPRRAGLQGAVKLGGGAVLVHREAQVGGHALGVGQASERGVHDGAPGGEYVDVFGGVGAQPHHRGYVRAEHVHHVADAHGAVFRYSCHVCCLVL